MKISKTVKTCMRQQFINSSQKVKDPEPLLNLNP